MPRVQASILPPYFLKLESGLYHMGQPGQGLEIYQPPLPPANRLSTMISLTIDQPNTVDPEERSRLKIRQADQLLNLANRLLRCYRATTRNATIIELSRAEASPCRFWVMSEGADPLAWEKNLDFKAELPKIRALRPETIAKRVRALLASGNEPEVADLFLLDAELAIHEGRFREAVLFCWSTIDATFNRKYDQLVESKLTGEWAEARSFFRGLDFGLKNKMSAALYLISGRSLFREPEDLWQKLSNSYNKRNAIIHRGESRRRSRCPPGPGRRPTDRGVHERPVTPSSHGNNTHVERLVARDDVGGPEWTRAGSPADRAL